MVIIIFCSCGGNDVQELNNRAQALYNTGSYATAIELLNKSIDKKQEGNAEAYIKRAACYFSMGSYAKAINDYTAAIKQHPGDKELYLARGKAYELSRTGKEETDRSHGLPENESKAYADYARAIAIDPLYADALNMRGSLSLAIQDPGGAIADFNQAIKADPVNCTAYTNRSIALRVSGQLDLSIEDADKAISLCPTFANAYFSKGVTLMDMKEYPKAFAEINKANQLDPGNGLYTRSRGVVYFYMGQADSACKDWEAALTYGDDLAAGLLNTNCRGK